jgi:hypothetical protein
MLRHHDAAHTEGDVCCPLPDVSPLPAQAFGCYMHMSVIRLFVESILRYGLPPQFQAAVVKPLPKMEARLRTALAANFGTGARQMLCRRCAAMQRCMLQHVL